MATWFDAGRRAGLQAAIAQLTARKQQLFEIYNAAQTNQLNRACALEITTVAIETIEECLGEAMHTEKNLRLTSKIAKRAELEHDLEIWRQAYNAAISAVAYAVGTGTAGSLARDYADMALANYLAKREEMGI